MQASVGVIEHNVELANIWLNELSQELHGIDKEDAWARLAAVLQTVRDRVPVGEAVGFAAQLPYLLRGVFYEAWHPAATPQKWRHKSDYFDAVTQKMGMHDLRDTEDTVRAVLKVAARHMDKAELEKIKHTHPREMWDLWPE